MSILSCTLGSLNYSFRKENINLAFIFCLKKGSAAHRQVLTALLQVTQKHMK